MTGIPAIPNEMWKDIKGYEGLYLISSKGNIMSLKYGKAIERKVTVLKTGYCSVCIYNANKKLKTISIHRLVALAFIPNPDNLKEINHKDYDKQNNSVENLEWCNRLENARHSHSRPGRVYSNHRKGITGKLNAVSIPVIVTDLHGNFLKRYDSQTIAASDLGLPVSHVSECCNGIRKTCHKLKFIKQ